MRSANGPAIAARCRGGLTGGIHARENTRKQTLHSTVEIQPLKPELTLPDFRRKLRRMAKKSGAKAASAVGQASRLSPKSEKNETGATPVLRQSALLATRVVYCGDNLEQLAKLPDTCVDLIYIA